MLDDGFYLLNRKPLFEKGRLGKGELVEVVVYKFGSMKPTITKFVRKEVENIIFYYHGIYFPFNIDVKSMIYSFIYFVSYVWNCHERNRNFHHRLWPIWFWLSVEDQASQTTQVPWFFCLSSCLDSRSNSVSTRDSSIISKFSTFFFSGINVDCSLFDFSLLQSQMTFLTNLSLAARNLYGVPNPWKKYYELLNNTLKSSFSSQDLNNQKEEAQNSQWKVLE